MKHSLEIVRAKGAGMVTKDDYIQKKTQLNEKLKQLYEDDDESHIAMELSKLEYATLGEANKSLIGGVDSNSQVDDTNTVDMAKQLMEKLQEERNEHKRIMREKKLKIKEQNMKREAEIQKQLKQEEEERERLFKEKQQRIVDTIEQRKNKIQHSKKEMASETRKRVRKSPLHVKIISEFEEQYVMPELEKRKETLANIRSFKTPIRINEIREHSQRKKALLTEKLKEYEKKREFYIERSLDLTDKYRSKFWKQVKDREAKEKVDQQSYKDEIKHRQKKKVEYAKNAMELYKPTISKKKRLEMTLIRQNMNDPGSLAKMRKGIFILNLIKILAKENSFSSRFCS